MDGKFRFIFDLEPLIFDGKFLRGTLQFGIEGDGNDPMVIEIPGCLVLRYRGELYWTLPKTYSTVAGKPIRVKMGRVSPALYQAILEAIKLSPEVDKLLPAPLEDALNYAGEKVFGGPLTGRKPRRLPNA